MRGRERIEIAGKFAVDSIGGALDLVHGASAIVRQAGAGLSYRTGQKEAKFRLRAEVEA